MEMNQNGNTMEQPSSDVQATSPVEVNRHMTAAAATTSAVAFAGVEAFALSAGVGATSGMVGITAIYPVDVLKTRLQHHSSKAESVMSVARKLLGQGPRALYKGLTPQLVGTGPDKAISLATRDFLLAIQDDPTTLKATAFASSGAGAVQSLVMSPVELVKVRCQLDPSANVSSMIRSLGLKGCYRGFSACFARDVAFSTSYFTLYAFNKKELGVTDDSSVSLRLLAATAAGVPAALLTTPMDVVKTRMQAEGAPQHNAIQVTKKLVAEEGSAGLMKGWGPRVARIAPQFGIVLVTYDWLMEKVTHHHV